MTKEAKTENIVVLKTEDIKIQEGVVSLRVITIIISILASGISGFISIICCSAIANICSTSVVSINLNKEIKLPLPQCNLILSYLRENCLLSEMDDLDESLCRDKKDIHVLGLAQRSLAEYIITGDQDLLCLVKYKKTKIVTPRGFWTILKENEK